MLAHDQIATRSSESNVTILQSGFLILMRVDRKERVTQEERSDRTQDFPVPMKIGIMLRGLSDVGGPGEYARCLLEALLRIDQRNEYHLFTRFQGAAERYGRYANARVTVFETQRRGWFDQVLVPREARRLQCDVLVNFKHSIPLLAGIPSVFVMHGADWIAFPQNYYFFDRLYHQMILPFYCRRAAKIISVSHDATRKMQAHFNLPAGKVATVHHGFQQSFRRVDDAARRAQVLRKYGLPEKFILFVGRIYPMKNVRGLVAAFARIAKRVPHQLVIGGVKHFKTEADFAAIQSHGLNERVSVLGYVEADDLPVLYSLASAFVMPSLYEGFGIPLLEAMACGCPVVTSTQGACPEVVDGAAVLVDPFDESDIARGIEQVLTSSELSAQLVVKGYARVAQFSWEKCAWETLEVLRAAASDCAPLQTRVTA